MLPFTALLITYGLTTLVGGLAAIALRRPLAILLGEVCGTEERSRFWTVWSTIMMIILPVLLVSLRDVRTNPVALIQSTLTSALIGVLLALLGMGYAVWSRSPRADA